ncbi:di-heme oxidoredictase family protein [Parendozoicomonas sp. Alg238-R29]|uniref:di-heme oxidoreductase family protein n=1 Tax=Parendozoicomonas sp. Alg238-R29 TaxID=2993446 RepID=UPI00248F3B52|nr:di-heme oxidoredictase family protein [Parendozoicomonas sp. Alg238-R29]
MNKKVILLAGAVALAGCSDTSVPSGPEPGEALSGGGTTVYDQSRNAYSLPAANLGFSEQLDFKVGNSFFKAPWVTAPATTTARDGLGPLMNTNGCQNCHIKDGRGHAPMPDSPNAVSLLIRLSRPAQTEADWEKIRKEGGLPDSVYGGQLQDFANPGITPEGKITVEYTLQTVALAGGETAELRKPVFRIVNPGYGEFAQDMEMSPRVAPPMIGLGLLEAISEQDILAQVDENDSNQDGISGRANWVKDQKINKQALGRFGWKAGQPSLRQQNAGAFAGDMGLTSTLFRDDCTEAQQKCLKALDGGEFEVSDNILDDVTFYTQHLAVPARRTVDNPEVLKGKQLFAETGCTACHTPSYKTVEQAVTRQLSDQKIWPYTDLLLHDMGKELADNRPEFLANGQEWRTPPLWGIGLAQTVSKEATFLHDGRARTLLEAVLWHGGEAQSSRGKVVAMAPNDRKALIQFLESL